MKNNIILIMKGFLIGIAKVIPGVSGSLLAVSLGIYEKAIESISHFFRKPKENILFLGKLGTGILIAIILCSKFVLHLITHYYVPTMFLFVGLIGGGIPSLFTKFDFRKSKNKFIILIIFILFLVFSSFISLEKFVYQGTFLDHLYLFIIGFLDAFTMVVPGISGTLIFLMLGVYEFVMYLFGNVFELIFSNPIMILLVASGVGSGIYITSWMMNRLFCKYSEMAYTIISGFMISSLYLLISKSISKINSLSSFLLGILCIIIGYSFAKRIE